MFEIKADNKIARATNNHRWLVKWTDEAKHPDVTVVYLMKRGPWFRIGWCQLFRSDGGFHVAVRARGENADSTWILRVTENKTEASIWESFYSAEYGIPTAPFEPVENATHYTRESLDVLFEKFSDSKQLTRAKKLLKDRGLSLRYPIWSKEKARTRQGGKSISKVESCNLIPELMALPLHIKRKEIKWVPIESIQRSPYNGDVYSLDVEKYHTYVTEGLVTCNCIYSFSGADPATFLTPIPDDHKTVLEQSYRVPRQIHARAMETIQRITKREPKEYRPRLDENNEPVEGELITDLPEGSILDAASAVEHTKKYLDQGKSVMFLTTCAYMLNDIKDVLKERGIPYHNPYKGITKIHELVEEPV